MTDQSRTPATSLHVKLEAFRNLQAEKRKAKSWAESVDTPLTAGYGDADEAGSNAKPDNNKSPIDPSSMPTNKADPLPGLVEAAGAWTGAGPPVQTMYKEMVHGLPAKLPPFTRRNAVPVPKVVPEFLQPLVDEIARGEGSTSAGYAGGILHHNPCPLHGPHNPCPPMGTPQTDTYGRVPPIPSLGGSGPALNPSDAVRAYLTKAEGMYNLDLLAQDFVKEVEQQGGGGVGSWLAFRNGQEVAAYFRHWIAERKV